ncbi:DsbA family oxidoreductase [Sphaerisporangium sp. NPDC088356]|uniref:DsbA family oxidoreductase n=1 Tax=Sphaerisporangium sp. NPDC088356 TaxID=3154871 RepID=UPI0034318C19
MKVEIFSDVVCPWCYIGHTRFTRAAERYREQGGEVEVRLRPFQLAPDAESLGEPLTTWMERKFGGPEQTRQLTGRVTGVAAESGLDLHMDHAVQANSFDAHRLILAATEQGKGEQMAQRLFRAYFSDGLDIGSRETLAKLAGEVGVQVSLDGEDGAEETRAQIDRARELGISGVPLFLFEGKYAVSGAQPEDTLLAALEEVASLTGQAPPDQGEACSV